MAHGAVCQPQGVCPLNPLPIARLIRSCLMSFPTHIFTRIRKSHFVRNLLTVMTGTAIARAIGLAVSPVISRLFTPADFGLAGSFSAVAGVIAAGVTLEYTQAIMLPKEKSDAFTLFLASCLSTLIIGALCLLACLVFPARINGLMKTTGVWALAFLVLTIIVSGLNQSCQAWSVRAKAFKNTSASQVFRSVSSSGMQIGFGLARAGAPGLVISSVLADLCASIPLLRVLLPDWKALRHTVRWDRMKHLAREYRDFPLYSASQNVINALSLGLPVLLLTHFYSLTVAGAYAFGIRLLMTPMSLLLTALRQVLFQKACETQHNGDSLVSLYVRFTAGLFALALLPALVMLIWSPQLFTWVFGPRWELAGEFARSLTLWLMFTFCNLPAILFARLIRIQRTTFIFHLSMLAARVATLTVGGLFLQANATILLFSLVGAAMNLFLILLVGRAVMAKEGNVTLDQLRQAFTRY